MKEFQYTIKDENGIHARPAGLLVQKAKSFQSNLTMLFEGKEADMKRLFTLMGLNVKQGSRVTVRVVGTDEETAAQELEDYFKNNL